MSETHTLEPTYIYEATIVGNYDGDTLKAIVDLGMRVFTKVQLRLLDVDTPELRGGTEETKEAGRRARDRVRQLTFGEEVVIRTQKDKTGKYGRFIAEIQLDDGEMLGPLLIKEGHAVEKHY